MTAREAAEAARTAAELMAAALGDQVAALAAALREADDGCTAARAAVARAVAEGLRLAPSSSSASGYRGINVLQGGRASVFFFGAYVRRAGKQVHLGSFVTAEEAALAFARTPEAQAQVAAAVAKQASLAAKEALAQQAALEGP